MSLSGLWAAPLPSHLLASEREEAPLRAQRSKIGPRTMQSRGQFGPFWPGQRARLPETIVALRVPFAFHQATCCASSGHVADIQTLTTTLSTAMSSYPRTC
jgi:hypothetical protein